MKTWTFAVTTLDGHTLFTSVSACTPVHAWFAIRDTRRFAATLDRAELLVTGDYFRNRSAASVWAQIEQEAA